MCDYCHSFPHLAGCPNQPEPKAVFTCEYCREAIVAGDEYITVGGNFYHVSCIAEEMNVYEILDIFEVSCEVATDGD